LIWLFALPAYCAALQIKRLYRLVAFYGVSIDDPLHPWRCAPIRNV